MLVAYYPQLAPPGRAFPSPGSEPEAREHKFVVLVRDESQIVAIGPVIEGFGYLHADIVRAAAVDFPAHEVRGGGTLRVFAEADGAPAARLSGQSGAYGPFDPLLREADARLALTRALGRQVVVG